MISRRNIRVKVMQLMYVLEVSEESTSIKNPVAELKKQFDNSKELFYFLIFVITEIARYAEVDAKNRASKNITSEEDLNVNIKLAGNDILWAIMENASFQKEEKEGKHQFPDIELMIRKLYLELIATNDYQLYAITPSRENKAELWMIELIFNNIMLQNEDFQTYAQELFSNWDDDAEMMQQLVNNFLHKPKTTNIQQFISEDKWHFARTLLTTMIDKKEYCLELIQSKLKNWDSERIALLDMLLMRMGICELLYFETIPVKVTINECIDIAKEYSTPQSGQFINGILDNLHLELMSSEKINKISFNKANSFKAS